MPCSIVRRAGLIIPAGQPEAAVDTAGQVGG
jgi:hypothetical protein